MRMMAKNFKLVLAMICFTIYFSTGCVWAGGFALYEFGARAIGMGSAFTAQADDPSAVFYNPAGISQLEGLQMMSTIATYTSGLTIDFGDRKEDTNVSTKFVPQLFTSYQINDKLWLGVGAFTRFGLATDYDDDWAGRYNIYYAESKTMTINPNLVLKASDSFSIGMGVSAMSFETNLEQKVAPAAVVTAQQQTIKDTALALGLDDATAEGIYQAALAEATGMSDFTQKVNADDKVSFGYVLSLHCQPIDKLSLGLLYRSKINHRLKGTAKYENVQNSAVIPFEDFFYNTSVKVPQVGLPDLLVLAVAYQVNEHLTVEIDWCRSGWKNYDELALQIDNDGLRDMAPVKTDYHNGYEYRIGAEYVFNDTWAARVGFFYETTPIPDKSIDYMLPSNDYFVYTIGGGYKYNRLTVDMFYELVLPKDRHIDARPLNFIADSKIVDGQGHNLGLSLSYAF